MARRDVCDERWGKKLIGIVGNPDYCLQNTADQHTLLAAQLIHFEPNKHLDEDFTSPGMLAHPGDHFLPNGERTNLIRLETITWPEPLKLLVSIIGMVLFRRLQERLNNIKAIIESGQVAAGYVPLHLTNWVRLDTT